MSAGWAFFPFGMGLLIPLGHAGAQFAGPGAAPIAQRMMALVTQLGVIVVAARLGHAALGRMGMPGVLGELLAGILIGPYLLGAVPLPLFSNGLFPRGSALPVSPELYGVCSVAAVVLLFVVGLETDVRLFLRYSVAGTFVGLGGVIVSFLLGSAATVAFSSALLGQSMGFLSAPSVFMGIITTATSVGITARILSDRRRLDSPEGVTILSGAVLDDVLGMVLLAVGLGVMASSRGEDRVDWARIGGTAFRAVAVWLAATAAGILGSRFIGGLLKRFRDRLSIAVTALGLALILAGLFEKAGLAMIIGAYVAGLSLSRTDVSQAVRERLHPIYALLVPVFFAVMGMLVDVRQLASGRVLAFGFLYTLVAVAAKLLGCGIPAVFSGFNWRGALRIGAGMLPRGEVTLIMAGTGLTAGILSPQLFGVVVLMTLVSTLLAPPLLVRLFGGSAPGMRRPAMQDRAQPLSFSFPSARTAELLVDRLLAVFELEGFFVHTLDRHERLYQLRKDETVIGFQQKDGEIVFDCRPGDQPLLSAAMWEVLAELERTLEELRRPIDVRGLMGRLQRQQASGGVSARVLEQYLAQQTLKPELRGEDKQSVIDELIALLVEAGLVRDAGAARDVVWARERSMSTGMQHGIAIPHGKTDAVSRLVCAIGLKPAGVDFDSIDGSPARIIVLTLSPREGAAPHVQFMSTISQALNDRGRFLLLACGTPGEMFAVLTGGTVPDAGRAGRETGGKGRLGRLISGLALARRRLPRGELAACLSREVLKVGLRGQTASAVIDELLEGLARRYRLDAPQRIRTEILEREARMPTGLEHGLAMPHARSEHVDRLLCAVGTSREGVDFKAADGKPSRIVVLAIAPKNAPAPLIRLMALVSRMLDESGRKRILAAETNDALWSALIDLSESSGTG